HPSNRTSERELFPRGLSFRIRIGKTAYKMSPRLVRLTALMDDAMARWMRDPQMEFQLEPDALRGRHIELETPGKNAWAA
ncbi:hypothetical protein ABTN33_20290, partial [Acinetobacter baumannii]